ncbi:MAG: N-acetylglucosamine-6-phosphate deacetylase [Actinomycetota bacterium]|nr:N-acetylglucosamine-6-phosphate deacetylase [Actinomycetota bacterium]
MPVTITAPRVLTGTADLRPGWVRFDGSRVESVGAGAPPTAPDIALPSGVLVPGLVDAQVNGGFGVDFAAADDGEWADVARALPATGVTSAVPTFITAPVDELAETLRRFGAVRPSLDAVPQATRMLPAHVEGPFLSLRRRGAHRSEYLSDPAPEHVETLIEAGAAAGGSLGYLTLAPERQGAPAAVRRLVAAGVRVSIGHTDADEAAVHAAADAGATLVTHLYNAQRPFRHRDPGVVGAALVDDRLTCGLVVDGHHVHETAVRIAFTSKPGQIMLVTDAVAALGMPEGSYELGGQEFTVRAGEPPRRADGTIAGGAGRLDDAISLTVAAGVPLKQAVEAATRVPAAAVGRPDLGRIAPGCPADLVWLDAEGDHLLRTRTTWIGGVVAACHTPFTPAGSVG